MTEASVERTLGLILGKLEGQDKTMAKADESRSRLYKKLDVLDEKIDIMDNAVKDLSRRIGSIEPTVDDINKWRERGVGALLLIGFMAAALGSLITAISKKLVAYFTG